MVALVHQVVARTRATPPGRRHGLRGPPQAGGSARKRVGGPPEALERRSGINSTRVRAEAFRKGVFVKGVCSRISAALSCDTVKTRFSGSGGAGRSPARKFYGQALFSRQNLHAIRPTAPRWIALIETCTKHAKQGECGAARGLQERTCLRNAVATAMDARSCGTAAAQGRTQSTAAAQQPWCSTPALAKRAQLRPARTLGKADVHCSDSAVRRTFCTNCEPFAAHPRVEKNTCAKRRHNL